MRIHICENRSRKRRQDNTYTIIFFMGFVVGLVVASVINLNRAAESREINAVLVYQIDEQTRLIGDIVGVEAAERIRQMSHEWAFTEAARR